MAFSNDTELCLSSSLETKALPDGTLLWKQTSRGEYLVLTGSQAGMLQRFSEPIPVHDVLRDLLAQPGRPKIRAFYDLVRKALDKGFLHEGATENQEGNLPGHRWPVRCTFVSSLILSAVLIGAGSVALARSEMVLIPDLPGWFLTFLFVSLSISLAYVMGGAALSGLGREVYRPQVRLDRPLPFFSVDLRDSLMGGRKCEAAVALQMLATPFLTTLLGWTLGSTPMFLAGWITILFLACPFGSTPAHMLLHALFRKQHQLTQCAGTFFNTKLVSQLLSFKDSLIEEGYFRYYSTWAVLWLGGIFQFASLLMRLQANRIVEPGTGSVTIEPGGMIVILVLALVVAAPLAYLAWVGLRSLHRWLAPKLSSAESGLQGGDGAARPAEEVALAFLGKTLLFSMLPPAEVQKLAKAMDFVSVKPDTAIIRERDTGELMFVVYSGVVEVRKEDEAGEAHPVARLGPGEIFGEVALLDRAPRNSSVVAVEPTSLFALKRADFDSLLVSTLGAQQIQQTVQVCAFLRRNALFADWPPSSLTTVAGYFEFQDCPAHSEVIRESQPNDHFYLIYEGEFAVRKGGQQVATLGPGDFCGETSLLQSVPASADVVALRNGRVLRMPRASFLELVSRDFLSGVALETASDRRATAQPTARRS